ncbi:hypothetical protein GGI15_002944 [Coemansia interrupta]|uniref:PIG-P domain-containing protein n=1 Tax=Coemansia interrupta TaxID=1126814 RepID=A0A9W8HIP8_9FUNG|nr:hypothetical protein GGI15_002944 [Coemansia interrupta]
MSTYTSLYQPEISPQKDRARARDIGSRPRTGDSSTSGSEGAGASYGFTYNSHDGFLRRRTRLGGSFFSQHGGQASGNGTNIQHTALTQSASLSRIGQESFGISESHPSSLSSANGRPATAKTPTFEYYGFVIYLVSLASFIVYLVWAYVPDHILEAIGITYYPDRYWALALPAWLLTAVGFAYLFNMAANMYSTPILNSMDNITDPYSNLPKDMDRAGEFYSNEIGGIPPVSDLSISLVNKCLYQ